VKGAGLGGAGYASRCHLTHRVVHRFLVGPLRMIVGFRDEWLRAFFVDDVRSRHIPPDIQSRLFRKLQMIDDATTDRDLRVPLSDLQAKPGAAIEFEPERGTLRDVTRDRILQALRDSGNVVSGPSGAAARLGVKRTTLQSMMRRLDIRRPSF